MFVFFVFACVVLLSLVIQWLSRRWQLAVGIPCIIYLMISGSLFSNNIMLALTLGLPMIFFAGLLGSFLYETKLNPKLNPNQPDHEELANSDIEKLNDKSSNDQ